MFIFERYMENSYKYTVAGHTFAVVLPEGFDAERYLKPYEPFAAGPSDTPLFTLSAKVTASLKDVAPGSPLECLNDEAPYFWIFETPSGSYNFGFSYTKDAPNCILIPSDDFKDNVVYVAGHRSERYMEFALSNALMLLYTFCTSPYDTLMVHASVVSHDGGAYMFLGRSGTGKSTHSRLWLQHIEDTYLLNDDNPVIRYIGSEAYVYGTPWSGKTPCYKNEVRPLKAIVRLSQAPFNRMTQNRPLQAFASLMPACSCMRWDSTSVSALHKTVEKVIGVVPMYHLECLPDEEAARLCNSTVKK